MMSELVDFYDELFGAVPPENDPYLHELTGQQPRFIRAGLSLFQAQVHKKAGDEDGARKALNNFKYLILPKENKSNGAEPNNYLEQLRQEVEPLIRKYEQRIRALKERLKEEEVAARRDQ